MHFPKALFLVVLMASPGLAQVPGRMQETRLPGSLSCQLPVDWLVNPAQGDTGADGNRPHPLLQARPIFPMGLSRGTRSTTLAISRWPVSSPAAMFAPGRNPLDMTETFALRQALALEGFSIAKAWTTSHDEGGVQVIASTYVGTAGRELPWVVETTTWQDRDAVYAAQLRYPEQLSADGRRLLLNIKGAMRFKDQPTQAFASGYVMLDGAPGLANRNPVEGPTAPPQTAPASIPGPGAGTPAAASPSPSPSILQADAAEVVRHASGSLVLVEGKEKVGSGFVCNLAGQKYMITNNHVISSNTGVTLKPIDRMPIQVGAAAVAVNHDLVRFAVTSANPALELLDNLSANLSVGDEVLVLGNSEGAQVINPISGHVVGIGPDLVEVDAPFVSGNSGSPILQVRTGKVIGVATYIVTRELETLAEGSKEKKVRRFGYRLDSVASWQAINWPKFNAEAADLKRVEELTYDLAALWKNIAKDGSVHAGTQQHTALRRAAEEYVQATQANSRASAADVLKAKQSFLSTVQSLCTKDIAGVRPTLTYDYYQRKAADEQDIRNEFSKVFEHLFRMQTEESSRRRNNS